MKSYLLSVNSASSVVSTHLYRMRRYIHILDTLPPKSCATLAGIHALTIMSQSCMHAHTHTHTHTHTIICAHTHHTHSPPVTESIEDDTPQSEEEGGEGEADGGDQGGNEEEGDPVTPEPAKEEDEPGSWEETFKTHTDSKPHGTCDTQRMNAAKA